MRIDIITMDAVPNYGSGLQAYATKKALERYGCNVSIINYARENVRYENLKSTWAKDNWIKGIIMTPTIRRWRKVFGEFRRKELGVKGKTYTSIEDFRSYPLIADAYCTGSDQVWNSKWNEGVVPPLY